MYNLVIIYSYLHILINLLEKTNNHWWRCTVYCFNYSIKYWYLISHLDTR